MKRFGSVTLVLAGFIAGLVFVYSCNLGGNGNDVEAQPPNPTNLRSSQVVLTATDPNADFDIEIEPLETFILTDIVVSSGLPANFVFKEKNGDEKFEFTKGITTSAGNTPLTQPLNFNSGIVFGPDPDSTTITVESTYGGTSDITVFISGYLATN